MKRNHIAIVLDESGSMHRLTKDVTNLYNSLITTLRERSKAEDQFTKLTFITFDVYIRVNCDGVDIGKAPAYQARALGSTALFDAVGKAIELLAKAPGHDDPDTSFLVMALTDGEENASINYNVHRLKALMAQYEKTGRWTFAFQVPPKYGVRLQSSFGIPHENIREWEATSKGVEETRVETQSAIGNFYKSRAAGQSASASFFAKVTTDLSGVDTKKVKAKLDDLSHRFKAWTLDKEAVVKNFVETKTVKPYVIGSAYYQLMKPEKVQHNKEVLIVEKGKKTVWGGQAARDLIGLPHNQDAKVVPGNHSNYDIYVQSRSVNRKLPRGTKVLVDVTQTAHLQPTWGTL